MYSAAKRKTFAAHVESREYFLLLLLFSCREEIENALENAHTTDDEYDDVSTYRKYINC